MYGNSSYGTKTTFHILTKRIMSQVVLLDKETKEEKNSHTIFKIADKPAFSVRLFFAHTKF